MSNSIQSCCRPQVHWLEDRIAAIKSTPAWIRKLIRALHNRKRYRSSSPRAKLRLLAFESRLAPAVFTVLNANDSGAGSLRDALTQANATVAADTINFDSNFFSTPHTISLLTALPYVSQDVSIVGPGASLLTVQRDPGAATQFRDFLILINGKVGNVTLSGMTLTGGSPGGTQIGGGVGSTENTVIDSCVITGNSASRGGGVGTSIYCSLTIRNSTISGNTSSGAGGGVFVQQFGSLRVSNSNITGNTAATAGGGICLQANNTLLLENSTVSGNTASGTGGGGIYSLGQPDQSGIVINNSTIANNSAPAGTGGGILVVGTSGAGYANSISLNNVTVAGNSAGITGGGIARTGTGSTGAINLTGTVVARNAALGGNPDIIVAGAGPINANNSLVFDQTGLTLTGTGNLAAGTDPLFVGGATPTLANNGGTVQTIALQAASPLIDTGLNGAVRGVDARGNGFPRTIGTSADIGSFEFAPTPGIPSALANAPDVTTNGGTSYAFTVTYTDIAGANIGINTASFGNDDVTVAFTDSTGATTLVANAPFVSNVGSTATYTVAVPGGTFDSADYGQARIAINAGAVTDLDGNAVPAVSAGSAQILTPAAFTVTTLADAGAGSLRQAIADANSRSRSADSIVIQSGLTGTISLASGLVISDSVTIAGPGAASLTLAGNNTFRLIVTAVEGVGDVSLSGMTLTGGQTASTNGGGALFIQQDHVTLDGVTVTANTATAGGGGGIAVQIGGTLTIRNSTISDNTSTVPRVVGVSSAGGINFILGGGTLDLENSSVTGNSGTNGGGIGDTLYGNFIIRNSTITGNTTTGKGGGFYTIDKATVLVENSTISSNTASLGGGGIADRQLGTYTISSSTISGNTTTARGGGGFYMGLNGSALVENSTISGNAAPAFEGGGFYFFGHTTGSGLIFRNCTIAGNSAGTNGGGIGLHSFGNGQINSSILIQDCTIAGNTAGTRGGGFADISPVGTNSKSIVNTVIARNNAPTASDVNGALTANFSLVRDQTGATITGANNLAAGTDPLFVGGATPTLTFNGGSTQTIAIQIGSPLINAGTTPAPELTGDQRGAAGFVRSAGNGTDIGAFEFQAPLATVVNDGSAQRSLVTSLTVTFAAPVTFATTAGDAFTLTRVSDGAVITFTATASTVNGVTQVVLNGFGGAATNFGSLADGRYTLTALSSQITLGGSALDGDGDGAPGGDYHFGDTQGLFRFYGDINGDRHVDISDFGLFSSTFNLSTGQAGFIAAFDFNGDGHIDIADFGQFSIRFFTVLP